MLKTYRTFTLSNAEYYRNPNMETINKPKSRWQWLDAVKGISILLVMISHICELPPYLGNGCVSLFFIVAGYTAHKQGFKALVGQKAKRLLIPYFFYGLSFFFAFCILARTFNVSAFIGLFYSRYCLYPLNTGNNIFLLQQNAPLWFATAMFVTYLGWYVFCRIKESRTYTSGAVILCFILSIAMRHLPILLPWSLDISFFFLICMIYGKCTYMHSFHLLKKKYRIHYIWITVLYLVLCHFNGGSNPSVREYGDLGALSIFIESVTALGEALLLGWLFQLIGEIAIVTRTFAFIGKHSLRLMCIHLPIFFLITGILPSTNSYLLAVIKLTVVLAISIAIERIAHKLHLKYL